MISLLRVPVPPNALGRARPPTVACSISALFSSELRGFGKVITRGYPDTCHGRHSCSRGVLQPALSPPRPPAAEHPALWGSSKAAATPLLHRVAQRCLPFTPLPFATLLALDLPLELCGSLPQGWEAPLCQHGSGHSRCQTQAGSQSGRGGSGEVAAGPQPRGSPKHSLCTGMLSRGRDRSKQHLLLSCLGKINSLPAESTPLIVQQLQTCTFPSALTKNASA